MRGLVANNTTYDPTKKPGLTPKLCQKWIGPFYISKVLSGYTYIVRRCSNNKQMKSSVNIHRLKPYVDPNERPTNHPPPPSESAKTAESDTEASSQSVNKQHTQPHDKSSDKTLIDWLVVFNVPSTARSFRDSTPIYCPLRRM